MDRVIKSRPMNPLQRFLVASVCYDLGNSRFAVATAYWLRSASVIEIRCCYDLREGFKRISLEEAQPDIFGVMRATFREVHPEYPGELKSEDHHLSNRGRYILCANLKLVKKWIRRGEL